MCFFSQSVSHNNLNALTQIYYKKKFSHTHPHSLTSTHKVVFFERLEHVLRAHESSSTNARSGGSHTLVVAVRNRVTLLQRKFCVLTALWAKLRQVRLLCDGCT